MKTQVVYSVISSENDTFLEELWVSAWSLRHYNPGVRVVILADAPTARRIEATSELMGLISEVKAIDVPENYTAIRKSRVIKTNVRNHVDGDYLYLDTDTVVCVPLDEIDTFTADIACVPDGNVSIKEGIFGPSMKANMKNMFGMDIGDYPYYFNAGIMYVKDNELTRRFFTEWHKNWEYTSTYKGTMMDMPAMMKTDIDMGCVIQKMPDVFNAQVTYNVRYLHEAKILHFVNMNWIRDHSFSPFIGKEIYWQVKEKQTITEQMQDTIINCKSAYKNHSIVVGRSYAEFLYSTFCRAFMDQYLTSSSFRSFLNNIGAYYIRWQRIKKKLFKR